MKRTIISSFLTLIIVAGASISYGAMRSPCRERCNADYARRLASCDNDYSSNGIMTMRQVCSEEARRAYSSCLRTCPGQAVGPVQPINPWEFSANPNRPLPPVR